MKNSIKLLFLFLIFAFIGLKAQAGKALPVGDNYDVNSETRIKLVTNTIKLKKNVESLYQQGMSYQAFRGKLLGTNSSAATAEGENLISVIYGFLRDGKTDDEIMATYSGAEMGKALVKANGNDASIFATPQNSPKLDLVIQQHEVKGGGCKWYQISCWIDDIFGAGTAAALIKVLIAMLSPK